MLDSLDGKERSYDNSTNGINFTIRKVNLMFVFIVVVGERRVRTLNKYILSVSKRVQTENQSFIQYPCDA